jgi:tetratricopeptide (TPR) repeat protein
VLWRTGRTEEALQAYQALQAQTRSASVEISLGSLKRELGRVDQAIAHYEAALEMEPYLESAWQPYLRTLFATGRDEALTQGLRTALERRPDFGTARVISAMVALEAGTPGAAQALAEAIDAHPDEPGARTLLAGLARKAGELETAERLLREELSLPRPQPGVRMALIEVLATRKDHAAQLAELDIVLRSSPRDPVMLHARAQALFNLKRHEDALAATRTCLEAAPAAADCKLLEANALKKLGKEAEAQAAWQEARAMKGLPPQ